MGIPRVEKCCCCVDLKTGNIIIGCLNATLSFTLFIIMVVVTTEVGTMKTDSARELEMLHDMDAIEEDARLSGLYAMSIILVFMFLGKLFFDLFFVYGVVVERAGVIKAYFIVWIVFTLLSMFTFFLNCYYYGTGTIITELIHLGVNVYGIIISYSFYVQLNMREVV